MAGGRSCLRASNLGHMADNTENTNLSYDPTHVTHIRPERPAEVGVINAVIMQAFADVPGGDGHQSYMVEKLRGEGQLTFSFVSINEGRPVGHICVLPVKVITEEGNNELEGYYALGPVAVLPDLQDAGHGSALVHHAIGALQGLGAKAVVTYGTTEFFSRFGFSPVTSLTYPGHEQKELLALALDEQELPTGSLEFPEAFEAHN